MYLEFELTARLPGNTTLVVKGLGHDEVLALVRLLRNGEYYKGSITEIVYSLSGWVDIGIKAEVRGMPNSKNVDPSAPLSMGPGH